VIIIVDKGRSIKEFEDLLNNSKSSKKGVNLKPFAGKLKWKGNALKVQRSLRNEQLAFC
jgi:hypothetical protein